MTDKELRKMNRIELIEIIYALQQEEKRLEEEKKALEDRLEEWTIQNSEAGSIAEAAVKVNKIFEVAQMTADQYLEAVYAANAKSEAHAEQILEDARKEQEEILASAREKAEAIQEEAEAYRTRIRNECNEKIAQTNEAVGKKWQEFDERVQSFLREHSELSVFLNLSNSVRRSL